MGIKDAIKNKSKGNFEKMIIERKLNKLFLMDNKHDIEERRGLHASSVVGPKSSFCYREQVLSLIYKMNNDKNDLPIRLLKIFRAGNDIHEKWQGMFEEANIDIGIEERRYSKKYDFYMTPDAIIKVNGKAYVVEIKSQNTFAFKKQDDHKGRIQLNLYMHFLGIPRGFVLVEDKNNQEFKVYMHEYNPQMVKKHIKRLVKTHKYKSLLLKRGKMVKGICKNKNTKRAKKCGMRDACFDIGQGRVKLDDKK